MKFDTKTNLNMQDLMVVFILSVFRPEYPFWQIWPKKRKLSVWAENWYTDWFEYDGFDDDVHYSCFQAEVSFFLEYCPVTQNSLLKLQFRT